MKYELFLFCFVLQVLVEHAPQLVTAVFSRSSIAGDDTTAVPGLGPSAHGAQLLQTMTMINFTVIVEDENVRI